MGVGRTTGRVMGRNQTRQYTLPSALRVVAKQIPALLDLGHGRQQRALMIASRSVISNLVVLRWITWHQMDGVTGTVRCARTRNMTVGRVGRTTGRSDGTQPTTPPRPRLPRRRPRLRNK